MRVLGAIQKLQKVVEKVNYEMGEARKARA